MDEYNKMKRPRIQSTPGFYGEQLIESVVIRDLTLFADERGFLLELMRLDDKEMKAPGIKQIIASYSYPGMIKGWHLHFKQEDHLVCVTGTVKLFYMTIVRSPPHTKRSTKYLWETNALARSTFPQVYFTEQKT